MLQDFVSSTFDGSKEDTQNTESTQDNTSEESPLPDAETADVTENTAMIALQTEVATLKEQLLRTLAEAENTRKRTFKEKEESVKYALHGFARELLTVADNLTRALSVVEGKTFENSEIVSLIEGMNLTERELQKIFEKHHIKQVTPQPGDAFDHNLHQAMFEVDTDQYPVGSIATVMQNGYVIYDRLLRPALVGVAKASANDQHIDQKI